MIRCMEIGFTEKIRARMLEFMKRHDTITWLQLADADDIKCHHNTLFQFRDGHTNSEKLARRIESALDRYEKTGSFTEAGQLPAVPSGEDLGNLGVLAAEMRAVLATIESRSMTEDAKYRRVESFILMINRGANEFLTRSKNLNNN